MLKKIFFLILGFYLLWLSFSISFSQQPQEERITITTYYPSPYGSYNQLQTNSLGVGDNNNNGQFDSGDVPTTPGDVWIRGKVGIRTTNPQAALDVNGTIVARNDIFAQSGIWLGGERRTTWPATMMTVAYGPHTCGSGWIFSTATCPPGYVRTGCSGFFNYACWGDWWCDYLGTYPVWDNECVAVARGISSDSCLFSYAYCLKVQ